MLLSAYVRLLPLTLMLGLALGSCSAAPDMATESAAPQSGDLAAEEAAPDDRGGAPDSENATARRPQLIRTATIEIEVESVDDAIAQLSTLLQQQRGDILNLSQEKPHRPGRHESAALQLRVPQENLDATLEQLSEFGNITRQEITAQDVSDQLIDLGARLRNLQRAEESLLEILDRAGGMSDVLAVSQELRNVRQEIEQIDAQRTNLQNRVAYSTINLQITAIAPTTNLPSNPLGQQFSQTWQGATRSLRGFTIGLLRLLLWLLVWSPYWGIILLTVILWRKSRSKKSKAAIAPSQEST